ncbi:amino acid adenylation domain-containing protein [Bacillus timonensis]|nr:amino acid adenylation domain-containing protein [Bacillus timonensis]
MNSYWPLTFSQERQWLLEQLHPGHPAYLRPCVLKFVGELDVELLFECVNAVIERHDALRTYFPIVNGQPVQSVRPFESVKFRLVEMTEEHLHDVLEKEVKQPFDLESDVLYRGLLLKVSQHVHVLCMTFHHLVFDGWSQQNFQRELALFYKGDAPAPLPLQMTEFAQLQRALPIDQGMDFWREKLHGPLPQLSLPTDFRAPADTTLDGRSYTFTLDEQLVQEVTSFCRKQRVTPFVLMTTVLNVLLHRYTGEEDLLIGTLVSGRQDLKTVDLLGLFVNTVLVRTGIKCEMTCRDALLHVRDEVFQALSHQHVPYTHVATKHGKMSQRLFNVMVNFHNMPPTTEEIPGIAIEEIELDLGGALVDVMLTMKPRAGKYHCSFTYQTELFHEATIVRMSGHFVTLLEGMLENPDRTVGLLPMVTSQEKQQLLFEWNDRESLYPRESHIIDVFLETASLYGSKTALVLEDDEVTYQELDEKSSQLAHYLLSEGMQQGDVVAVFVPRSAELIISFLAILKAGGSYLPIDPMYPSERIAYMLEDADVSMVISSADFSGDLPFGNWRVLLFDECKKVMATLSTAAPQIPLSPTSVAYVMYTSGSTGMPKGVAVPHLGIVRLVKEISFASVCADEVILQLTTPAFDVSSFEIYGALLNGGSLVMVSSYKPSLEHIARSIEKHKVTSTCMTPEILQLLVEHHSESIQSLRDVISCGDVLPVSTARKVLERMPHCRLINGYGPTENSVFTTAFHVKELSRDALSVPIGTPIASDKVYLLDEDLQPVPIGVAGKLYASGDGLALRYLNKEEITAGRFVDNPFLIGEKMYDTGDIARYRKDGVIEFLGRKDHQVKIRGCRIELGEVETLVSSYQGIGQAIASVVKGIGESNELVVYVVMDKGEVFDAHAVRSYLQGIMPEYMVPSVVMKIDEVPLTPVGKLDRRRLPQPVFDKAHRDEWVAARSDVEKRLVLVWEELLSAKDRIGVKDSFFSLGGHSLLAMRLFSEIEREFGVRLPVSVIFKEDTVEKLALKMTENTVIVRSLVQIQTGHRSRRPLFCIHALDGEVMQYYRMAKRIGEDQPVYGLRYVMDENLESIEEMAARYVKEIRSVSANGPYVLIGHSLGGVVAYEMARQLAAAGCEALPVLLDTKNPAAYSVALGLRAKLWRQMRIMVRLPLWEWAQFFFEKVNEQLVHRKNPQHAKETMDGLANVLSQYETPRYDGKVVLFQANDCKANVLVDEFHGWRDIVELDSLEIVKIAGDHHSLLKEPHVDTLVEFLRKEL